MELRFANSFEFNIKGLKFKDFLATCKYFKVIYCSSLVFLGLIDSSLNFARFYLI